MSVWHTKYWLITLTLRRTHNFLTVFFLPTQCPFNHPFVFHFIFKSSLDNSDPLTLLLPVDFMTPLEIIDDFPQLSSDISWHTEPLQSPSCFLFVSLASLLWLFFAGYLPATSATHLPSTLFFKYSSYISGYIVPLVSYLLISWLYHR